MEERTMSKLFKASSNTNTSSARAQKQNSLAYDDVDRIARRTPALFRTNAVPQIQSRRLENRNFGAGGA